MTLKIAVHGDDNLSFGMVKASLQRRCLPVVPCESHDLDATIGLVQRLKTVEGSVDAAIVDEEDFERRAVIFENANEPRGQRRDVFAFVVHRNHDRQVWIGLSHAVFFIQEIDGRDYSAIWM